MSQRHMASYLHRMVQRPLLPDETLQLLWRDGRDAHAGGQSAGSCPHREGSSMQFAWLSGWEDAKKLAETRQDPWVHADSRR